MQETTSREFVDWNKYLAGELERELETRRKEDYYLAQIACEVRRANAKHPGQVKLEHFLLKFGKPAPTGKPTEEELARRTAVSKAHWAALMRGPARTPKAK